MFRERTPPLPPPPEAPASLVQVRGDNRQRSASGQARRASWQHQTQADRRRAGRFEAEDEARWRLIGAACHEDDDFGEQEDWRQNAQMLTERDEMLLLVGDDALDVAPVNRRKLQQQQQIKTAGQAAKRSQTPTTTETSSRHSPAGPNPSQKRTFFTLHKQLAKTKQTEKTNARGKTSRLRSLLQDDEEEDDNDETTNYNNESTESRYDAQYQQQEDNDDSSISFAQSGCHSILSAWRIKAANRAARLASSRTAKSESQNRRPRSVLSNGSSVGRKSAASTAYTQNSRATALGGGASNRIALGPKSAQHFVTNTRRRRRANELIMSTLEARRRAISLNRQNLLGSLFGSESYLGESPSRQLLAGHDDYQRLSMTPSPARQLMRSPSPFGNDSTAAVELTKRSALSDLGGRQSPATAAQRSKLLLMSRARSQQNASPTTGSSSNILQRAQRSRQSQLSGTSSSNARPPLAKLDQNSSDLCSSNDSSSGSELHLESSSSSCSQFTQLVTRELTPSEILLGNHGPNSAAVRERLRNYAEHHKQQQQRLSPREKLTVRRQAEEERPVAPPRVPSRTKRSPLSQEPSPATTTTRAHQNPARTISRETLSKQNQQLASTTSEDDDKTGAKLRRGALKRDSIRRLRLTRQQQQQDQQREAGSSSSNDYNQQQQQQQQPRTQRKTIDEFASNQASNPTLRPLSKARKLDIETNPFLNRHHFRTLSSRSTDSRQSAANQALRARVSPTGDSRLSANPVTSTQARERAGQEERRVSRPLTADTATAEPGRARSLQRRARTFEEPEVEATIRMPQIDMENVRKVELMLEELRPQGKLAQATEARPIPEVGLVSPTRPQSRADSNENVFKTTTRLVREGARSSDNLKSDLAGNRKQLELTERWRHESQPPVRRPDGSIFSEQRYLNERLEIRKSQELTRSISPPAEFSDRGSELRGGSSRPAQSRPFVPTQPPTPTDRFQQASRNNGPIRSTAVRAQQMAPSRSRPAPSQPPARTQSLASPSRPWPREAAPVEAPRKPPVSPKPRAPRGDPAAPQPTPARALSESRRSDAATTGPPRHQASLPKFERTADDEFRKRVDHLRQMARAHLEASEAQAALDARRREQAKLVRPMSTNWEGPVGRMTADSAPQQVADKAQAGGAGGAHTGVTERVASTNLDEMLLADRYQRPLTSAGPRVGAWGRSNSSLASIGSSRQGAGLPGLARTSSGRAFSRPTSPPAGDFRQSGAGSVLSQSVLSSGPSERDLPAPMRVIVREKRAPQLDFAQVEQRQPTQHARTIEAGRGQSAVVVGKSMAAPIARQPPTAINSVSSGAPGSAHPSTVTTTTTTTTTTTSTVTKSDQVKRVLSETARAPQSPRSPEFGRAAASSNDDSAIASSISSPSSMNIAVPPANQQSMTGGQPARPGNIQGVQERNLGRAPSGSSNLEPGSPSMSSPSAPGSTIQSILRRQHLGAESSTSRPSQDASSLPRDNSGGPFSQQSHQTYPMQTQLDKLPSPGQHGENFDQFSSFKPATESQQQQKRVHFNDRTSVRSFESISSTNSNTTAIQQHQQSDLDDFGFRQQVGSPDSMGSGSTSRLSCESPAFGDFRGRVGGMGDAQGGAAIYAIRGDPDLDLVAHQALPMLANPAQFQMAPRQIQNNPQLYVADQRAPPISQNQHLLQRQVPAGGQQGLQYGGPGQPHLQMSAAPVARQQIGPSSSVGTIRMTAPPAINTNQSTAYQQQQMLSPASSMERYTNQALSMVPGRQQRVSNIIGVQESGRPNLVSGHLDEEDPDYAFRLRQAATRRVFNYGQPQQQQAGFVIQTVAREEPSSSGGGGGDTNRQAQRRPPVDLANFQTEV